MMPISLTSASMSACGSRNGDAGAGGVERIGVRVAPVVVGRRSPRPGGSRLGASPSDTSSWPAVPWSLTVATTPASSIVAHALHGLVEVAAVVAGGDLDARAVGAAARVERLGRRLEGGGLVLERDHRRLEDGHQAELRAARPPRRTGRRPTGRWPRSRSPRRARAVAIVVATAVVIVACRTRPATSATASSTPSTRTRSSTSPWSPLWVPMFGPPRSRKGRPQLAGESRYRERDSPPPAPGTYDRRSGRGGNLTMRTVVVGASSGLGRCIGIGLAQRGGQVALMARRGEKLETAAQEAGGAPSPITCDVTDVDSCQHRRRCGSRAPGRHRLRGLRAGHRAALPHRGARH